MEADFETTVPTNVIGPRSSDSESLTPPPGTSVDFFVRISFAGEANFYRGLIDDGPVGVFVPTYRSFPVGTIVALAIELAERSELIFTSAVVKWLRYVGEDSEVPPGIGLELLALSRKTCDGIREFGRKRPPLYYDVD